MNDTVTSSAYTQARKKLKHTAFKELNENVLSTFAENASLNRYKGYLLQGVDGSKLNLPDYPEIAEFFGRILNTNQTGMVRYYSSGLFLARYDVLNKVCVSSILVSGNTYEGDAFVNMMQPLSHPTKDQTIMIFDRGFASQEMIRYLESRGQLYVIRIPRNSFKESQTMFISQEERDKTVVIGGHQVRLVRVELSSGEVEVLATNVLNDLSVEDLKEIYHHRWGVETFFDVMKNRLGLENFTGKTLESVLQDFWSTIFVCNLEASCTHEINQELQTQEKPRKVNKSVSFNVLKNKAFELLFTRASEEGLEQQIKELFLMNQTPYRRARETLPRNRSERRTINYLKYRKKLVF